MASQLAIVATGMIAALASATPTLDTRNAQCADPKSVEYNATFDDTPGIEGMALNPIPIPYKGMYYQSFSSADAIILNLNPGIYPHSGHDYAASQPLAQALTGEAELTTNFNNSNSSAFSLQSWHYGCVLGLENGAASLPAQCSIIATGYQGNDATKSDSTQVCAQTFLYNPGGAIAQQALGEFDACFKKVQYVVFTYTFTGIMTIINPTIALLADDFVYKLYYC